MDADDDEIYVWADETFNDGDAVAMCAATRRARDRWAAAIALEPTSHDKIRDAHWEIFNLAAEGHTGWVRSINDIEYLWANDVTERHKRGIDELISEVLRSRLGALRKIKAIVDQAAGIGARYTPPQCTCIAGLAVSRFAYLQHRSFAYSPRRFGYDTQGRVAMNHANTQDFNVRDFEAAKADIFERYADPDDSKFAEHVWDATRRRLVEDAGSREVHRLIAHRLTEAQSGGAMDGLQFLTSRPEHTPLWGDGSKLLWARGQGLLICGPQGVGKSTVAQRLILARMGLIPAILFDHTVAEDDRPVLYLAMDRPDQIHDSLLRMVDPSKLDEDEVAKLKRQLIVWPKQPPFKADLDPERFAQWVAEEGRDPGVVVFDSVKDMLTSIVTDEAGLAFNTTVQLILANGTDTVGNHHQRKPTVGNFKPDKLADVYGSTWLTAGQGSVVLLWGEPGARSVELRHLKPIRERVGPLAVNFDHATGRANGGEPMTILMNLAVTSGKDGMTLDDAVRAVRGTTRADDTWRAHSQAVKRLLDKLVERALLKKIDGQRGGPGGGARGPRWVVP
ncbi:AAA family ATPase [Mycobacterium sp. E2733]|uniref:AAA family ATPase n=1 Tax=Mycobacterium sp. E2733 TaxID=1834138 RepID=UPI0034CD4807